MTRWTRARAYTASERRRAKDPRTITPEHLAQVATIPTWTPITRHPVVEVPGTEEARTARSILPRIRYPKRSHRTRERAGSCSLLRPLHLSQQPSHLRRSKHTKGAPHFLDLFHRFDPTFPPHLLPPPPGIPGILPPFNADEAFDMDEHGNLDWKSMWKKELSQLIQVTEEQEKTGIDQEWFRIMLWKLRAAFFTPPPPPAGHPGHPPHPGHPGHPHTPVLQPPPPPPHAGNSEGVVLAGVPVQQTQQDR